MLLLLLDLALAASETEIPRALKGDPDELPAEENTAALIARAKAGDGDAFSALVQSYEKFVYHSACRVLSACGASVDLADDIAQDSFVKAWRSLDSFRGDCAFSTWLFRITVNTARDTLRSAARHPTVSLTRADSDDEDAPPAEWDLPVTSGDTVPESAVEQRETVLAVRRAIEQLPEEQRQVIVMRDLNDLPYKDIAEALGVELGTVKSRLNRGRASLKLILQKSGLFGG